MSINKNLMIDDADTTSGTRESGGGNGDREEILEILKLSQKETFRILLWRVVVTGVLAATAFTVTFATYRLLVREQHEDFKLGFDKFSTTVGDAAVRHQETMRDSFRAVTNAITVDSLRTNATWPYYTNPYYELYAGNALVQSNAEIAAYFCVVQPEDREKWGNYSAEHLTEFAHAGHMIKYGNLDRLNETNFIADMRKRNAEGVFIPDDEWYEYWPMWLYSPPPAQYGAVNWNLINVPDYEKIIIAMKALPGEPLITKVRKSVSTGTAFTEEEHNAMHSRVKTGSKADFPHAFMWTPIYDGLNISQSNFVALVATGFAWDFSLRNLLPESVEGVIAVVSNNCNQTYTYEISGIDAFYLGEGDLHEPKYDSYRVVRELSVLNDPVGAKAVQGHCEYTMTLYPSSAFEKSYDSNTPELFAFIVAFTFGMVAVVFLVYDILVQKRNNKLVARAARLNSVVSSLFPETMRDRILAQGTKSKMKSFLKDGVVEGSNDKPLADLFLSTTIMFADITGFTAWSSVREPFQVFTLLEAVYSSFDSIAKSRNVFKVETVGDCYVAASGIPEPRKDHAVVMVRFATDCIKNMRRVVKDLEVSLGPDTGDLNIRVGMHSGPVTAGVLRGERARFQLFGDTMNTTSRVESASEQGRILVSQETADLIVDSGKGHWLKARKDLIEAKGKGPMQTFWVNVRESRTSGVVGGSSHNSSNGEEDEIYLEGGESAKQQRLVEWNVEMLARLLKQVVARRNGKSEKQQGDTGATKLTLDISPCPLDDVREIITLPEYDIKSAHTQDPSTVELSERVMTQLRNYVSAISRLYRKNPFHNFEHASHVAMSVQKLLSRIIAPDKFHDEHDGGADDVAATMHDHTYGITSDPLTQFACAFSAMIHDVDHTGVPNTQLIKENVEMATTYRERSVAEQNSLDLSWNLLMDDQYKDLRTVIYTTESELRRFRDLLVNSVMATDICDKQLKELRNARWEKAFAADNSGNPTNLLEKGVGIGMRDCVNRKATIVIEHLIQASDVSHTMQHWHVYRKWNERLFNEMYAAFKSGRASSNPADSWYKGELGFFDFYIIPLAKKLKECGVFGVSSDEFLNYALNNRKEWELRGEEVIAEMMQNVDVLGENVEETEIYHSKRMTFDV